jgi:hypothetical protein
MINESIRKISFICAKLGSTDFEKQIQKQLQEVIQDLSVTEKRSIEYSIDDFEYVARAIEVEELSEDEAKDMQAQFALFEEVPDHYRMFNRKKFCDCIHKMIDEYDPDTGINTLVIRQYLYLYCVE